MLPRSTFFYIVCDFNSCLVISLWFHMVGCFMIMIVPLPGCFIFLVIHLNKIK